jgi:hypothetical protein
MPLRYTGAVLFFITNDQQLLSKADKPKDQL